jgi:hypothetical protein
MTPEQIVDGVNDFERAVDHMLSFMTPGGVCCWPPRRLHGYCTHPACIVRRERYAVQWAREAAHLAHWLMAMTAVVNRGRM